MINLPATIQLADSSTQKAIISFSLDDIKNLQVGSLVKAHIEPTSEHLLLSPLSFTSLLEILLKNNITIETILEPTGEGIVNANRFNNNEVIADSDIATSIARLASPIFTGSPTVPGYVPTSRTVNSHVLTSNVTVSKSDVSLGSVTDDAQIKSSDFPSSSVDGEIALFNSTSGKSIKRASSSGLLKAVSGVLGSLALGTADYQLYMNAAGSDIEFASGHKLVHFSYDISTTGTQSITGVGFKGSLAIFFAYYFDGAATSFSLGYDDGAIRDHIAHIGSGYYYGADAVYSIVGSNAAVNAYTYAGITAWGSDGFTITKTKSGSPTGTVYVSGMVLR
jgi:hypothetical protein